MFPFSFQCFFLYYYLIDFSLNKYTFLPCHLITLRSHPDPFYSVYDDDIILTVGAQVVLVSYLKAECGK